MSFILPRRNFLKSLSGLAVASVLPQRLDRQSLAVFWEPGFPSIQGCAITSDLLRQSLGGFTLLSAADLPTKLNTDNFDLLINPFGSAFPKRAWSAILKYLRDGGNWLNCGGVPLSRPIVRTSNGWRAEPHQTAYHKRLGITHSFPVRTAEIARFRSDVVELVPGFSAEEIYELYIRLSSTSTEPDEAGSDGPREGVVESLVYGVNREGRPIAAPVIQIDRFQGEFAGGRWLLANFTGRLDAETLKTLAETAARGASRLEVRPEFACYRAGETPSVSIQLLGRKREITASDYVVEVRDPSEQVIATDLAKIPRLVKPGLYHVYARAGVGPGRELTHENGFWVYDEELLKRGKPLTADNHFFYRNGKVFPVTGTTYMASDVHRRFLFDPNPFVWDYDFRAMKAAGVNMVRTGIWTGWKRYMPEPGKVKEGALRAFDAFLLTAHKYDIPVIFTFFAFLPETWGGVNAYLDPRAVKAQQQFISAFTERCAHVDDVVWDFINEPSFCSPKHLWNCRPNYDEYERAAWKDWLKSRYPSNSDEDRRGQLQQLWRTTTDDVFELPKLQDFESVHLIDDRQPLKTLDYRLFAQEMFIRWVRQMTTAVRVNGNQKQLITVGQDEAGVGDSPNIQFFAAETSFTSLHNWWNNDDLVWDSVLAKVPGKASLMEETGVMFYERADGDTPWRSEEEVSRLLERKLAISFAADGAGFIEWVWNTNPYMNSTNEVGIGFHRVDGTAKPELEPFLRIAKFMGQHGQLLRDRQPEAVVMVIPHSHMFSPRSFAIDATRKCVRAMYYHCGVPMQAVSEYTLAEYAGAAKLIVVPAPRVLTEKCWDALLERAKRGATVAISGIINDDEHWLPVSQTEILTIGERKYLIRYEGEKIQRIEKAGISEIVMKPHGAGRLIRSPLPLELGDSTEALAAFYRLALAQADVTPIFDADQIRSSVLILPSVFRDVVLYTFVSEADRDTTMQVMHLERKTQFSVTVPAERTALVLIDRRTGKRLTQI